MSSPKARRRQRSARVASASVLLVIAAVASLGAVLSGSLTIVSIAAVLAVVLGATAVRITYSELAQSRRDAAADRARQAQSYRVLADTRTTEHQEFATAMQGRVGTAERAASQLEAAVVASQGRAAEAVRTLGSETRRADRAEAEGSRLAVALGASEERAAEAIVRVAELEQDNDVLRAELDTASSWHPPQIRHA
jgi:hypothetical protein